MSPGLVSRLIALLEDVEGGLMDDELEECEDLLKALHRVEGQMNEAREKD